MFAGFMGLPPENSSFEHSGAIVLPIPYEATVSYGTGTRRGPAAIIEASAQVEFYDTDLMREPAIEWGIHTTPAPHADWRTPEIAVAEIADLTAHLASTARFLCVLGGEHTVSVGVARGLHRVYGDFVTVQFDAHADLRSEYEEQAYSHACAARRISEFSRIVQVGVRSLDVSEAQFLETCNGRVTVFPAERVRTSPGWREAFLAQIRGRRVFLTFDVDVFDPSIMPSTGTPEPGGLLWYETIDILRLVISETEVIGFDCVELAPIAGLHAPDFMAAKLVYKAIGMALAKRNLQRIP
jgi:agmatinase